MDRTIRVCRSHGFVSAAKGSLIFDMAKFWSVFLEINYEITSPLSQKSYISFVQQYCELINIIHHLFYL